jgi:hypothetical protein
MTDLLDDVLVEDEFSGGPLCPFPTDEGICGVPIPVKGEPGYHYMRRYCDEHKPDTSYKPKAKPKKRDKTPRSVQPKITVQVGSNREPRKNTEDEKLKAGALKLLGFIPLGFALTGDATCQKAVEQALPAIADQLVALCEYHPGLKKILAPTETTGEAMAWFGLFMATSPVLIAILIHHNLLPEKIAVTLATTLGAMASAA